MDDPIIEDLRRAVEDMKERQRVSLSESACSHKSWFLGEIHPKYGEVVMMGITGGEPYRWFQNGKETTMIPLSFL